MRNRISIGLDVHARSVVGCALDGETGEILRRTLTPDHGEILSWIRSLPGPVRVTYEAGPTGFGLARFILAADVDCLVAAPSKLQRPRSTPKTMSSEIGQIDLDTPRDRAGSFFRDSCPWVRVDSVALMT